MSSGQTVLVTGGSRGVGEAIVRQLAAEGHAVTFTYREKVARASRLIRSLGANGSTVVGVQSDIGREADRAQFLAQMSQRSVRFDAIVLNASGGLEHGRDTDYAMHLNRDSQVAFVRLLAPQMADGGTIVFVTSNQAHFVRETEVEDRYRMVAESKRAGEDELGHLIPWLSRRSIRLIIVSADLLEDSATTLLLERSDPGSTERRRREIGMLPSTKGFASTIVQTLFGHHESGDVVLHAEPSQSFELRSGDPKCRCPQVVAGIDRLGCSGAGVRRAEDSLVAAGVRQGARVVLSDDSSVELGLVLVALMRLDVSIVLLDRGLTDDSLIDIAVKSGASAIIGVERGADAYPSSIRWIGDVLSLVSEDPNPAAPCVSEGTSRTAGFARWRRRADGLIMRTSGSSGEPRLVTKSGEAVLGNVEATIQTMGYRQSDTLAPILPFTHQYGMSLVLIWWVVGCGLVAGNHRRPIQTLRQALEARATVIDAIPAVYAEVVKLINNRTDLTDFECVRMWCVGGAPLPSALAVSFLQATGLPLLDGYGSTELGNVSLATVDDPVNLGRPLPGVSVSIRDTHGGPVGHGQVGEIWITSRYACQAFFTASAEGTSRQQVFRTGDLGSLDIDGRLQVFGRSNAVHRGGFTIYPAEMERQAGSQSIALAVIPLPDDKMGAHLTAFVEDPHGRKAAFWSTALERVLPEHEQPNRIVVLDQFPQLFNGKRDEQALLALARSARPTRVVDSSTKQISL